MILVKKLKSILKIRFILSNLETKRVASLETLKTQYSEKFNDEYLTKEEKKYKEKYQDYDLINLKIKLETLSNENVTEKAVNILSNYEYNFKLVETFEIQDNKKELEKKYNEATLFDPKQAKDFKLDLSFVEKKLENKQNEIINLIDAIDEKKLNNFIEQIEKNNELEKTIIAKIIEEKSSSRNEIDLMKDKIILLEKFSKLEKLYNKELRNNDKNRKKIFSVSSELASVESLLNSEYKSINIKDDIAQNNLKAIQNQIIKNEKRILVAENVIDKTKAILSAHSKKQKKDIDLKKKKLEELEKKEYKIVNTYKQDKNFSLEVNKVSSHYNNILKTYQKIIVAAKIDNDINYKVKSNIERTGKQISTYKKTPSKNRHKGVTIEGSSGLKSNVRNIFDDTEIRSTVGIHLEKDKENGWEI